MELSENKTAHFCNTACSLDNFERRHEKRNMVVAFLLLLLCTWIVVANLTIAFVFLSNRRCRKNVSSSQILSLSITDLQVGVACIAMVMSYLNGEISLQYNVCAFVFFYYLTSQNASMYHIFMIFVHRFLFIYHLNLTQVDKIATRNITHCRLILTICLTWVAAGVIASVPFAMFQRFGTLLPICSLHSLLGHGYETMLTLWCLFQITPQIVLSFLYCGLFIRLHIKWRSIAAHMVQDSESDLQQFYLFARIKHRITCNCKKRSNEVGHGRSVQSQSYSLEMKHKLNGIFTVSPISNTDHMQNTEHVSNSNRLFHERFHATCMPDKDARKNSIKDPCNSVPSTSNQSGRSKFSCQNQRSEKFLPEQNKSRFFSHSNFNRTVWQRFKEQRRILITMGILLLVLNICMTPLDIMFVIERQTGIVLNDRIRSSIFAISLINSALNPLVYSFRLRVFRECCISMTRKVFGRFY